jgi:hypothetical protein
MYHAKIPYFQVRTDCLLYYEMADYSKKPVLDNLKLPSYSGSVTDSVRKRILKTIDIFLQKTPQRIIFNPVAKCLHPFRLGFMTLTISDENEIDGATAYKHLLKPLIRSLQRITKFSYIWKAEFQKRGQLHYHLVVNEFIHWRFIRSTWNKLQYKLGILAKFGVKFRHYDPNSVDIHSVKHVRNFTAYLAKYLSKGNAKKLKGKTWDCSKDLNGNRFSFTPTNQQCISVQALVNDKHVKVVELEHCTIFKIKNPLSILTANQLSQYQLWKT